MDVLLDSVPVGIMPAPDAVKNNLSEAENQGVTNMDRLFYESQLVNGKYEEILA